jgi:hypothetical protein
MLTRVALRTLLLSLVLLATAFSFAEGPKYHACPKDKPHCYDLDLSRSPDKPVTRNGCVRWCMNNVLHISPMPIQGCAKQPVKVNLRIEHSKMDIGNYVARRSGEVDWDDGTTAILFRNGYPFNDDLQHTYSAAGTYYLSAHYGEQYKYDGGSDGSCSYECHVQQASVAIVYGGTSPECTGGSFHATKDSEAKAQEAVAELHRREENAKPVIVSLTPEKK